MSDSRDCGTKFCEMDFYFKESCTIFVPVDESKPCDYPCSEENCVRETQLFISCPVWDCYEKTTQTPSTHMTTFSPLEPKICSEPLCIGSLSVACILFTIVLAALAIFTFLRKTNRLHFGHPIGYNHRERVELSDLIDMERQRENEPLLGDGQGGGQAGGLRQDQQVLQNPLPDLDRDGFETVSIV